MQERINQLRDRIRFGLHRLSSALGEGSGLKPPSLVSQAKAAASVELDLPSIQSLLPYERVNEAGFFVNRSSLGFGLQLMPLSGADETLMNTLASLFKNRLTEGVDCTVLLYKHPWLSETLASNYAPYFKAGNIMAELAELSCRYHDKARLNGYPNARRIPATLADYQCFLFLSVKPSREAPLMLARLRDDFEAELKVAGFSLSRLSEADFARLMGALLSPDFSKGSRPAPNENGVALNERLVDTTTLYEIDELGINVSLADLSGVPQYTRVVNCELASLPSKTPFALWQTPDLFASLLNPERGIDCPFLLSMTIRGVNQEKVRLEAKARAKNLTANSNGIVRMMHPGIVDEASEWRAAHEGAAKGELHLLPVFYNLTLYTTCEQERTMVANAMASYREAGFTLAQSRLSQWPRFLGALPFLSQEGFFHSLTQLGLTRRLSHFNVANLLPVVADSKGAGSGLILPTCRNQLYFFNAFEGRAIDNYNQLTIASPGAGKSFFQQAQILDGLARGEQIFVIDLGGSYKHLCHMVGGSYIDASSLTLNPFTLFDFDGSVEMDGNSVSNTEQIRDLLAIMASPEPLGVIEREWLLKAVHHCLSTKGRDTLMDDVLEALNTELNYCNQDIRLRDLILLLKKYGTKGLYGAMFNGKTPLLNGSRFTVLELEALEATPDLMNIVLFVMIAIIQGQFYQSDRRTRKR
ncbi:type IV secretion system protein TraC, partial [Legionella sp. 28fT52]|uniref:type IV secretion system protein TraC n=1 Tax=Legionella sp. 28fT52 TaxID=3410134 RepID=UPI003AF517C1